MSSPKSALNPRIKISKTGRPYVDVADLVKSELDRIKRSQNEDGSRQSSTQDSSNTNRSGTNDNGATQEGCPTP
jgi:hypothetical protein